MSERPIRVAIAHDYLTQRGGAERVVLSMLRAFPDATLYTSLYHPEQTYPEFGQYRIVTSALNRIPMFRANHRAALPFLAWAMDRFGDVPSDVLIASSSGWGHAFKTKGKLLVYCYSPARWLYQPHVYLGGPWWKSPKGWALRALRRPLVRWDRSKAARADAYLTSSRIVAHRINKAYGITATLLPPPFGVNLDGDRRPIEALADWADEGFLLIVSRLLPYKNVHEAMEAVRGTDNRLAVIGHGPMLGELQARCPDNVRLVSGLDDAQMRWAYEHCTHLIAPSFEDFGLTPIEAALFGKPAIALRGGGYLDTIREGVTGVFFDRAKPASIRAAIERARSLPWDPDAIHQHAMTYSEESFIAGLQAQVRALADSTPPQEVPKN